MFFNTVIIPYTTTNELHQSSIVNKSYNFLNSSSVFSVYCQLFFSKLVDGLILFNAVWVASDNRNRNRPEAIAGKAIAQWPSRSSEETNASVPLPLQKSTLQQLNWANVFIWFLFRYRTISLNAKFHKTPVSWQPSQTKGESVHHSIQRDTVFFSQVNSLDRKSVV